MIVYIGYIQFDAKFSEFTPPFFVTTDAKVAEKKRKEQQKAIDAINSPSVVIVTEMVVTDE